MGSTILSFFFMILSLGGGGDLLDLLPTDAYWHAKGGIPAVENLRAAITSAGEVDVSADIAKLASDDFKTRKIARDALEARGTAILDQLKKGTESKDPEVAATCRELITTATAKSQEQAIRKLMAIRTLGEMKDSPSVDSLKKLADSKEPFVADYAARALDTIAGKKYVRPTVSIDTDINLLPKDTGTVGQIHNLGEPITMQKLMNALGGINGVNGVKPGENPDDATRDAQDKMVQQLITLAETTGNLRLDGATVAVSNNVANNTGWVAIMVRGQFDRDAVVAALKSTNGRMEVTQEEGMPTVSDGSSMRIIFPSNTAAFLVSGPDPDSISATQKTILAALKTGKGEFAQNAEMAALLKQVDRTKEIWAVMQVPALLKQEIPFLANIDTLLLTGTRKDTTVSYEIKGSGQDAAKTQESVTAFKTSLEDQIKQMEEQIARYKTMAAQNPGMDNVVTMMEQSKKMLDGMKITGEAKTGTLTGEINILTQLAGGLGLRVERTTRAVPVPQIAPR